MLMRYRLVRNITVAGFVADSVPSAPSTAQISLDDWVADQAGSQPTRGHAVRLRFVDGTAAEVVGGSVTFQMWGKTTGGFWVSGAVNAGASGSARYVSDLTGDLIAQVTVITPPAGATSLQLWVEELGIDPLVTST